MPDHHLSEDSVTRSAEAFLRVGDLSAHVDRFRIASDRTLKKGMPAELCCTHEVVDLRSL